MAAHAVHGTAYRVCLAIPYTRGVLVRTGDALAIAVTRYSALGQTDS